MLSRRALVGKLAAGAAVTLTGGLGSAVASTQKEARGIDSPVEIPSVAGAEEMAAVVGLQPRVPAPWSLLSPLSAGAIASHGWRLSDLSDVVDGSCILTLQNERGRSHRVHLCRNDGRPQGLVFTKRFDLVVMNGGAGDLPTDEGFAQAVAAVSHVVAANEDRERGLVPVLLSHEERVRRFSGTEDRRLR